MHKTNRMQSIEQISMWEIFSSIPCAGPESFVRGGPILTTFSLLSIYLMRGGRIQIPL